MNTKSARPKAGARTRKGTGSGSPPNRPDSDPLSRRMLRAAFADRGSELLGLCLVLGGLLAGLSIYFDRAGVVGRLVDDAAGWSVGLTKLVLPVAMVLLGFAMFRERYEFGEITRRMPVGGILCLAGLTGLLHLGRDTPGIDDGADALGGAGGLIGLGVGGGLDAAVATWGAVLILVGLVLVGLAVVTRTTARQAAAGTVRGLRPVGRAIADAFRSLLAPPGDPDAPVLYVPEQTPVPEPVPEPEPAEQLVDEAPSPKRRGKKRPAATDGGQGGEQLKIELGPATAGSPWKLPGAKALALSTTHDVDARAVEARGERLVEALAAHGVETRLVDMTVGPTVTRYALQVAEGVKVGRITNLAKDIAYELAAADVRILAPIPGQRAVGIEVPNEERETVSLGDILAAPEAAKATHPLEAAIGRDINGQPVMLNLATMPHILIAGATGAGKSSCI
ncbi:MAG: DNA translocase FtsK, partial [Actinomycetia bacterium]|nr:DNA translocase FtsK [Actinomycetes bacterium]